MLHNQLDGLFWDLERRPCAAGGGKPSLTVNDPRVFKILMAGESTMLVGNLCLCVYVCLFFAVWRVMRLFRFVKARRGCVFLSIPLEIFCRKKLYVVPVRPTR